MDIGADNGNVNLKEEEAKFFGDMIVGSNAEMRKILQTIAKLSNSTMNVLIVGETGTGKNLVARAIHQNSPRSDKEMITVDLSAIKGDRLEEELFGNGRTGYEGLFAAADGSTIVLDEIGLLDSEMQGKLLHAIELQEFRAVHGKKGRRFDVRLICTTSRNIEQMAVNKTYRMDLYYRLCAVCLQMPPLRRRGEDIPLLTRCFMDKINEKLGKKVTQITNKAMGHLISYPYPGNVRELDSIITQAVINADGESILEEHLPARVREYTEGMPAEVTDIFLNGVDLDLGFKELRRIFERQIISMYFRKAEGNITHAAEMAGIGRESFHRILKRLNMPTKRSR